MQYISGVYALNLANSDGLPLDWKSPTTLESNGSLFGDYGLVVSSEVPLHPGAHPAASPVRVFLDMLMEGVFVSDVLERFVGNTRLMEEIFAHVYQMRALPHWIDICQFMYAECGEDWVRFLRGHQDSDSLKFCSLPA